MRVLFMCTANSCRSQMAEAWARHLFPAGWEVASCGLITYPITASTQEAMAEVDLAMDGQYSKPVDKVDLDDFDLVVTLSREAGQFLPRLAFPERHLRWPVADPMGTVGSVDEVSADFRRGRDEIRQLVAAIVANPKDLPPAPDA